MSSANRLEHGCATDGPVGQYLVLDLRNFVGSRTLTCPRQACNDDCCSRRFAEPHPFVLALHLRLRVMGRVLVGEGKGEPRESGGEGEEKGGERWGKEGKGGKVVGVR